LAATVFRQISPIITLTDLGPRKDFYLLMYLNVVIYILLYNLSPLCWQDIRVPPVKMWKPDLLLYNSANEAFDATFPTNVIVKSDGSVSQIPPGLRIFSFTMWTVSRDFERKYFSDNKP
jgi:hypothetical protein